MKKLILILSIGILSFTLAACNSPTSATVLTTTTTSTSTTSTPLTTSSSTTTNTPTTSTPITTSSSTTTTTPTTSTPNDQTPEISPPGVPLEITRNLSFKNYNDFDASKISIYQSSSSMLEDLTSIVRNPTISQLKLSNDLNTMYSLQSVIESSKLNNYSNFRFPFTSFQSLSQIHPDLYLFQSNQRMNIPQGGSYYWGKGILDKSGTILLLPGSYNYISHFSSNATRVALVDQIQVQFILDVPVGSLKIGYLLYETDPEGNPILKKMFDQDNERYDYAGDFQGEYAIVGHLTHNNQLLFGVINKKGEYVVNPIYPYIHKEIIDNYVIIANEFNPMGNEAYFSLNNNENIVYFSEEVGLFSLASQSFVIHPNQTVISYVGNQTYFLFDSKSNVRQLYHVKTASFTRVYETFHLLISYSEEYIIGLREDLIYLLDRNTLGVVAVYERYFWIMGYFQIPTKLRDNNEEKDYYYNFNTYSSNEKRWVDFVLENRLMVLNKYTDSSTKFSEETVIIMNALGEIILELDSKYIIHNQYVFELSQNLLNHSILDPQGLLFVTDIETNENHAIDYEGNIVFTGYEYSGIFYNGKSLIGKQVQLDNETNKTLLFTLYNDGKIVPIDMNIDYIQQEAKDDFGNPIEVDYYIKKYSTDIYYVRVFNRFIDGTSTSFGLIMNNEGKVLYRDALNSINSFEYDYLGRIPEAFLHQFGSEIPIQDVFYINTGAGDVRGILYKLMIVSRTPSGQDILHREKLVMINHKYYNNEYYWGVQSSFVFNFKPHNQIAIYLNDVLVNPMNYTYQKEAQFLWFNPDFIAAHNQNQLDFYVHANDEVAKITVYGKGVPLNQKEAHSMFFPTTGVSSNLDEIIVYKDSQRLMNVPVVFWIYNLNQVTDITVATVNGVDIFNQLQPFGIYTPGDISIQFVINPVFLNTLEIGSHVLKVGNEVRQAEFVIHVFQTRAIPIRFVVNHEVVLTIHCEYQDFIYIDELAEQIDGYSFVGWYLNPYFLGYRMLSYEVWDSVTFYGKYLPNTE